ncbi:hypothetical protein LQV05_002625 [Cryptococcus neoformans]|nr:hypothetical protein C356_01668 [Cryptococcus neoformans var. grubii c45]OXB38556.1 hypothetical protein J007_01664 [Cryptococcus neoformans var. grubii]OXC63011.1 hypothetical protein C358_01669 [Cryptococcus neoformans var. grubii MW-RSA852]UOH79976.1 hypothetical protein LQV05_002625 [Cryptococcus neoformans]
MTFLFLSLLSTPYSTILRSSPLIPYTFSHPPPPPPFSLTSSKRTSSFSSETYKAIPTVVPANEQVRLPLFNIVDDNDSTQGSLAKVVAETWGIKSAFMNATLSSLMQQLAKTDFAEMVDDVNQKHVEAWSEMLSKSKPSIHATPITPFLDEHAFKRRAAKTECAVVATFGVETVLLTMAKFRESLTDELAKDRAVRWYQV